MAAYDFRAPRLFVDAACRKARPSRWAASSPTTSLKVLRLAEGEHVLAVQRARRRVAGAPGAGPRKGRSRRPEEPVRPQPAGRRPALPVRAAEARAAGLHGPEGRGDGRRPSAPSLTRHTQVSRVNLERMRANAVEAAEQCGILAVPEIRRRRSGSTGCWPRGTPDRRLSSATRTPRPPIRSRRCAGPAAGRSPCSSGRRAGFRRGSASGCCALPRVVRLSLGPRILRADTAAVAALALVQAVLGDWRGAGA